MFKDQIEAVTKDLYDLVDDIDIVQNGRIINISGWRVHLDYEDKDKKVQVGRAISLEDNSHLDCHTHESSEIFVLQKGKLKVFIDHGDTEKQVTLKSSKSTIFIESGLEHSVVGLEKGTEFLYIMFPSDFGLSKMFKKKKEW